MNLIKLLTTLMPLSILLTACNNPNSNPTPTSSEPTEVIEQVENVENPQKEPDIKEETNIEKPKTPNISPSKQSTSNQTTTNKKPAQNKPSQSKPVQSTPSQQKPTTPTHQHTWKQEYTIVHHVAEYRIEPIYEEKDVYEERPIYKYRAYWTCNECKKRFEVEDYVADHALFECGGGWTAHEERYQVGTETVYKGKEKVQVGTKQVLVKEAYDEKVPDGEACICGARR